MTEFLYKLFLYMIYMEIYENILIHLASCPCYTQCCSLYCVYRVAQSEPISGQKTHVLHYHKIKKAQPSSWLTKWPLIDWSSSCVQSYIRIQQIWLVYEYRARSIKIIAFENDLLLILFRTTRLEQENMGAIPLDIVSE